MYLSRKLAWENGTFKKVNFVDKNKLFLLFGGRNPVLEMPGWRIKSGCSGYGMYSAEITIDGLSKPIIMSYNKDDSMWFRTITVTLSGAVNASIESSEQLIMGNTSSNSVLTHCQFLESKRMVTYGSHLLRREFFVMEYGIFLFLLDEGMHIRAIANGATAKLGSGWIILSDIYWTDERDLLRCHLFYHNEVA